MRVFGFGGAENAYRLAAAVNDCDGPVCVDDDIEDNDARDDAAPVAPGRFEGLAVCPGDDDWYQVAACRGGLLSVTTRFSHAAGDVDLALHGHRRRGARPLQRHRRRGGDSATAWRPTGRCGCGSSASTARATPTTTWRLT